MDERKTHETIKPEQIEEVAQLLIQTPNLDLYVEVGGIQARVYNYPVYTYVGKPSSVRAHNLLVVRYPEFPNTWVYFTNIGVPGQDIGTESTGVATTSYQVLNQGTTNGTPHHTDPYLRFKSTGFMEVEDPTRVDLATSAYPFILAAIEELSADGLGVYQ